MIEVPKLEAWDEQARAQLQRCLQQLADSVNGGLHPTENFNAKEQVVTFDTADTETMVAHGLGRVPTEFHVMQSNAGAVVYQSVRHAPTADRIFLLASAPVRATIRFM